MKTVLITIAAVLILLAVLSVFVPRSYSEHWRSRLSRRDRLAFDRLVSSCGGNRALAEKMIAHEMLLDDRKNRDQAIRHSLANIENYRARSREGR